MARKVSDCRETPSVSGCTLTISGEEDEVVQAAAEHAVSKHGHTMSDELKNEIRRSLKSEDEWSHGGRRPESGHAPVLM